ncbi:MAG TPA: hypothetical protein VLX92_11425 [Kofleriaceae bacterium]|nr:hypothetical protein [Kofleriaceae bacterium]
MSRIAIAAALSLAVLAACKKDDSSSSSGPAAKPAEAKLAFKKLGGLPLEAEIPGDANVDDATKTAGFPSVTIYAQPTFFVMGGNGDVGDIKPTMDAEKTSLQHDMNGFKQFTRSDKTADGWIIELEGSSMVDNKPLYGVAVRRAIGGMSWDCTTNADSKDEVAKVEKECASLRAAK